MLFSVGEYINWGNLRMPYFGHMAYFVIRELHDINVVGSNLFASG